MRYSALCFAFVLSCFGSVESMAARKISVGPELTRRIEAILDRSQDLHKGLVDQEEDQVLTLLAQVKRAIVQAKAMAGQAGNNRPHLLKILDRTEKAIEQAQAFGEEKKKRDEYKDAFSQIVLLAQAYKLNQRYRIYFCSKDRSVWLQKKGRARNPINPDKFGKCGTIVRY